MLRQSGFAVTSVRKIFSFVKAELRPSFSHSKRHVVRFVFFFFCYDLRGKAPFEY